MTSYCQYTPDKKEQSTQNQTKICAIIVFYVYFVLYIELLFGDVGLNGSLGTFDFIPDGSNLNYYTSGVYMIGNTDKLENSPGVSWSILIAFGSNFIYSVQIVISVLDSKNSIYVRTKTETNKWCSWFKK